MKSSNSIVRGGALLSPCNRYRYRLWRNMNFGGHRALFIMLNPSTADGTDDDPTIRKCRGFTDRLGLCGFDVVNLFAFRATDPKELKTARNPVGPLNDHELVRVIRQESFHKRIVAWGGATKARKVMLERQAWFAKTFAAEIERGELLCLGTTKSGEPRHPLMLAYATKLEPWVPPGRG